MPTVDALAAEGKVFANTYTQASHSNYADPTIFSSQYPLRSVNPHVYPKDPSYPRLMVYDILKELGYRTSIFSSQNEQWGGMRNYLDTGGLDTIFHSLTYQGETYVPAGDTGFERFTGGGRKAGKLDDRVTVSAAIEWIEREPRRPFFMYLNLQNSHVPYVKPDDFPRKFGVAKLPFTIRFGRFPRDSQSIQLVKDRYADSLAYIDAQLNTLFDTLVRLGLKERTIVVVTGDTGQAFFEHGFAAHGNRLYNEVMRVPLIVSSVLLDAGKDNRPAGHIDIAPTILSLLGLKPHPAFQGISLVQPELDPNRSLYLVAQTPLAHQYAIVKGSYKLIYDYEYNYSVFYDLIHDPQELKDQRTSYPRIAASLRAELDTWRWAQLNYYTNPSRYRFEYPPLVSPRKTGK